MSINSLTLRGISISGAEAGSEMSYGILGMPSYAKDMQYFAEQGMNTVRIPINWDYIVSSNSTMQASASGDQYLNSVKTSIVDMLNHGLNVVLDLHSYMRFSHGSYAGSGNDIASAQEVYNVWSIISQKLTDVAIQHPESLLFEIANEPNSMSSQQMLANNNAGIDAIRDAGLPNMVILNGNNWTGLHSWHDVGSATDGISNAQIMVPENIIDPLNNYAISVHQYVDWNGSGTSPVGQSLANFKDYLDFSEFMQWVHQHNVKVFLGEFGSGNDPNGIADVNYLLQQVESNPYVPGEGGFIGWAAWVGGHTWAQNNFNYLGPTASGADNPLMTQIYANFLDGSFVPLEPEPLPDSDPTPPPSHTGDSHDITWNFGAREVINNFNPSTDVINLGAFWKGYNDFSLHNDGKGNLVIDLLQVDNHLITLTGVSLSQFSAANLKGVTGGNYQNAVGADAEYFSFKWNYGLQTTINHFNPDTGIIDLETFDGKSFHDLRINNDANGDATISIGFNNQLIKLIGVSAGELTTANFVGISGQVADAIIANVPAEPTPTPDPVPDPTPDPVPDPTPDPVPDPTPDPVPDPTPDPVPDPTPDPVPDPIPDPVPDPTPEPVPDPTPEPVPDPTPEPVPSQEAQVFTFGWNWGGRQVVNDFDAEVDKVDLSAFWTNFNNINIQADGSGNVVIDLLDLNNQTITLANTSLESLGAQNFKGVTGNYAGAVVSQPVKYYDYTWHYGANTTIDQFNPDIGVINLTAFNQTIDHVQVSNNAQGNAVINLGFDHQTITLSGVSADHISHDNFLM